MCKSATFNFLLLPTQLTWLITEAARQTMKFYHFFPFQNDCHSSHIPVSLEKINVNRVQLWRILAFFTTKFVYAAVKKYYKNNVSDLIIGNFYDFLVHSARYITHHTRKNFYFCASFNHKIFYTKKNLKIFLLM